MNPEIIDRFFNKQCTPAEAKEVAAYLKANPSVLEKYLSTQEWDSLPENDLPEELWNEIWGDIQQRNKANDISRTIKRVSVAACILLFTGLSYYYFKVPEKNEERLSTVQTKNPEKQQRKIVANTGSKTMTIVLEDSSVVTLSPNSSIQFETPFSKDRRDIILEGEGKFHVAKNKNKPFTVFAGAFATTALGTIFSVKKSGDKNGVEVKLLEGKVVVRSTNKNVKGWTQDVYLLAGQQLKFDETSAMLAIEKINESKIPGLPKIKRQSADSSVAQLNFSNTVLPEVMNKLAAYYNVKIVFDSSLIATMNFTGVVTKKDSPGVILKAITEMNGLDLSAKNENEFLISKP